MELTHNFILGWVSTVAQAITSHQVMAIRTQNAAAAILLEKAAWFRPDVTANGFKAVQHLRTTLLLRSAHVLSMHICMVEMQDNTT